MYVRGATYYGSVSRQRSFDEKLIDYWRPLVDDSNKEDDQENIKILFDEEKITK